MVAAAMNYRHAFHAGNFADVHKHAVLARILAHLRQKPAAFRVIDSHAGSGRYDLLADEATRGGEWRDGIGRLWDGTSKAEDAPARALLGPYLGAIAACNAGSDLRTYPGSPLIARHLMRPQDRLIACEIEPRAAAELNATLRGDARSKALAIDGWTAIGAYVPPKERRGVVFIDPPFEEAGDLTRLSAAFSAAHRKWPTGIYVAWYPIKTREAPDALARRLQRLAIAKMLRSELVLQGPAADAGLAGSGLIVVNPPFTLEAELRVLLPALGRMLARASAERGFKPAYRIDWLAAER
jgi:23S rRNA (adenine2030-N6)-methyltransferase